MQALSLRLSAIASLVPDGARVCDIGTDHGYLPIYLKQNRKVNNIIAADINPLPLSGAQKNIEDSGVSGIELRLCDGLSGISPNETDTVVIAGMGGEVIAGIIERGKNITENTAVSLILQPTTSPEFLRRFLYSRGFEIIKEIPVEENNKLYSVMLVKYIGSSLEKSESFYYLGKIPTDTLTGIKYIKKQQNRIFKCAQQLKGVPYKREEYLYYKKLLEDINGLLGEENGI